LWGARVVIPKTFQGHILDELHWEHPGMYSMKALARSYVWWPKLDADIESNVRACAICQRVRATPTKLLLHPWIYPKHPFQRVHIDFCEDKKQHFLILVDSYSKWVEVKPMKITTVDKTLDELRLIFA